MCACIVCLHSYVSLHRVLIYMDVCEAATLHVCVVPVPIGSIVHMLAQQFPLGGGKRVVSEGDKYTCGTLSAATQTQAGTIPAVIKRESLFVHVFDSLPSHEGKRKAEGCCQVGNPSGTRVIT